MLTPKERQVAEALMQGMANDEIGKKCGISVRAVKVHFNRMFLKARITSGFKRVKLAVMLYRQFAAEAKEKCSVTN